MSNPLRSAGASQRLLTPSMRDRVRKTRWQFSRTWPEVSRGWGKHASQLQAVFLVRSISPTHLSNIGLGEGDQASTSFLPVVIFENTEVVTALALVWTPQRIWRRNGK
jgi:hypothetical protein